MVETKGKAKWPPWKHATKHEHRPNWLPWEVLHEHNLSILKDVGTWKPEGVLWRASETPCWDHRTEAMGIVTHQQRSTLHIQKPYQYGWHQRHQWPCTFTPPFHHIGPLLESILICFKPKCMGATEQHMSIVVSSEGKTKNWEKRRRMVMRKREREKVDDLRQLQGMDAFCKIRWEGERTVLSVLNGLYISNLPMVFVVLQPLKHVASAKTQTHSSTCINKLIECNQSPKLGLLWILDLQSLTMSDH